VSLRHPVCISLLICISLFNRGCDEEVMAVRGERESRYFFYMIHRGGRFNRSLLYVSSHMHISSHIHKSF